MKKHLFFCLFSLFCMAFLCGCTVFETLEESDLSITELEERMEKAIDPAGAFRKADSYVQREMLKIDGLFGDSIYQIDLKYKKPNFLKLTTFENNQPIRAVIYNSGSAWQVDYTEKEVKEITGADLIRLNMLHKLTSPTEKYSQLFKEVKVFRCKLTADAADYYKIVCGGARPGNTISIYVNAADYLPRRINADLTFVVRNKKQSFSYDCFIDAYEAMDNVMIPQKTTAVTDGLESTTTVFEYKLNVNIPDSEFLPPIFTENKLRDRMNRFGKDQKSRSLRRAVDR